MVTKCHQCGKKTVIPWPQYWAYRRGQMFFCSWSCLRKFDKEIKGDTTMATWKNRIVVTDEIYNKAVSIALEGGHPYPYLLEKGFTNLAGVWHSIKGRLKKEDPAKYNKLPNRLPSDPRNAQKPKVDKGMPHQEKPEKKVDWFEATGHVRPPVVKVSGPIVIETPEDGAVKVVNDVKKLDEATKPKITKPLNFAGLEVTAVMDTEFGEFHFDHKYNTIDWRTLDGEEVCLNPTGWKNLAARLPEIIGVLGVQV